MMITLQMLRGACPRQKAIFKSEWPAGAEATIENVRRAQELGLDLGWGTKWFTLEALRLYNKATAEPRRLYNKTRAEAWQLYDAATAELYDAAMAEAWRLYDAATAEALLAALPPSFVVPP